MVGLRLIPVLLLIVAVGRVRAQVDTAGVEQSAGLSVREADALIRKVFATRDVDRYDEAVEAYLSLLGALDGRPTPAEAAILSRHLRAAAMVLPPPLRTGLNLDRVRHRDSLAALPGGAGARLVRWWRSEDTLPATPSHERLQEHLKRVVHALEHFGRGDDPRGFDDRGEVYVRLGEPGREGSIRIDPITRADELRNTRSLPRIPQNEVWVYPHVSDAACYIFVRPSRRQPYQLGTSVDLVPPEIRSRSQGGLPGDQRARTALVVLEEVYGRLALLHPAFGTVYDQVALFNGLPYPSAGQPAQVLQNTLLLVRTEDSAAAWRQVEDVPPAYSGTYGPAERLVPPVRWARFLSPDGTTRTEVYWGIEGEMLRPSRGLVRRLRDQGQQPSERYLLSVSMAQRAADYTGYAVQHKHYLTPARAGARALMHTLEAQGDTGLYHIAVQWEERWTQAGEDPGATLEPGARLKLGAVRLDSLAALDGSGQRLEMSDLKPLLQQPEASAPEGTPYPFAHLPRQANLALYFELYHLAFGPDDQTSYTLSYEVTRSEQGILPRLLGRDGAERTATETRYTGTSRTARETVVLDLEAWEGSSALTITIRATDEHTGAHATRSISFTRHPRRPE